MPPPPVRTRPAPRCHLDQHTLLKGNLRGHGQEDLKHFLPPLATNDVCRDTRQRLKLAAIDHHDRTYGSDDSLLTEA